MSKFDIDFETTRDGTRCWGVIYRDGEEVWRDRPWPADGSAQQAGYEKLKKLRKAEAVLDDASQEAPKSANTVCRVEFRLYYDVPEHLVKRAGDTIISAIECMVADHDVVPEVRTLRADEVDQDLVDYALGFLDEGCPTCGGSLDDGICMSGCDNLLP